jgi:hypothetical protein
LELAVSPRALRSCLVAAVRVSVLRIPSYCVNVANPTGATMKRIPSSLFAAAICAATALTAGQSIAQDKSASPMDQLDGFVGDGSCTGNVMAMNEHPGHATTGKYHGEKTLDGHWVVIRYDEEQTTANPKPFHVVQYFGYDSAKKRFVSVLLDSADPGYATSTSPGWKDDSITFDETTDGKVSFRDVFSISKSGMDSHTGWMKDKNGKWVTTDAETCKTS